MACGDYKNPAGLKFVTRVEKVRGSGLVADQGWPDGLTYLQDQLIMNIPNGVGPGAVLLQSPDALVSWRIVDNKNLVNSTQLAYTGPSSWAEVFLEDGGYIYARAIDAATTFGHVFPDGQVNTNFTLMTSPRRDERLRCLWFPSDCRPPTFDVLSLASGTPNPGQRDGMAIEPIPNNDTYFFHPPGLCRYAQVQCSGGMQWRTASTTGAAQAIYEDLGAAVTAFARVVPAWGYLEVINTSGSTQNMSINWNRLPSYGGP